MSKPKVFVVPTGTLQVQLFSKPVRAALAAFAEPIYNDVEGRLTAEQVRQRLEGCDAVITGWGTPPFSAEMLAQLPSLRVISHAAGSVKFFLPEPDAIFARGIQITSAAPAVARYTAECALMLAVACLRRVVQFREEMKYSDLWWGTYSQHDPDTLIEQRVGLVGLGHTSWALAPMLKALQCEVWAYTQYGDRERARAEGIRLVALDELLASCKVVFLLAAARPDTIGMISRERLKLMSYGAVLVNVARGSLVDEAALIEQLQGRRLWAGLDVTDPEPPFAGSPLRTLPKVVLTPHVGGPPPSRNWEMGAFAVEELRRFFAGEPMRAEFTAETLKGRA